MMDKRLNRYRVIRKTVDKFNEGIELIKKRHKKPVKGHIKINYDKYGNVGSIENSEIH